MLKDLGENRRCLKIKSWTPKQNKAEDSEKETWLKEWLCSKSNVDKRMSFAKWRNDKKKGLQYRVAIHSR